MIMNMNDFPEQFVNRVLDDNYLGVQLLEALSENSPVAVRVNPNKNNKSWKDATKIPWSKHGLLLKERPSFTLDPHFHGGSYYPQEAGSQFIDYILRHIELPESPVFLDLCAAPGGKSSLILDFLEGKGLLISNEINKTRASVLKENLTKWGAINSIITSNNSENFSSLTEVFDCVLVDAPCSGEGMFRKDFGARKEWSESNVVMCEARQKDIVSNIWPSIKQDGYLIYSTCTFNERENENNVRWILENFQCELVNFPGIEAKCDRQNLGYYCLPNQLQTEGFYFCVLRKKESESYSFKTKGKSELTDAKDDILVKNWIGSKENLNVVKWKDYFFSIPKSHSELIKNIHQSFHTLKLGTEIGEISKKGLIPNLALAHDVSLINQTCSRISVSREEALRYLKGETFDLKANVGYHLICFENTPLGWIKHLGNRFNNLYPKEYRIRMKID